jgi:hypothetical protein
MDYQGKLYGKVGNTYFETGRDSNDWDKLESDNREMRQILKDITQEFQAMKILNGLRKAAVIEKADQFLKRTER